MAIVEHTRSGTQFPLAVRTLIGRSQSCHIRLSSLHASSVHAELVWDGLRWFVHDLGSRNGTQVDGQRLSPERPVALAAGSEVMLGSEEERFVLLDGSIPSLVATADDGTILSAVDGRLHLPATDPSELRIFERAGGHWQLETTDEHRPLIHQERLQVGEMGWCIHLPGASKTTEPHNDTPMRVDAIALGFRVSRNDKYMEIQVMHGTQSVRLKSRAHDMFLLTLARARLADQQRSDLDPAEHGWVDRRELIRSLQADRGLINLWIHRARRDFANIGVIDAIRIIERREVAEQVRLGISSVVVKRLSQRSVARSQALW
ncbi:MAG: FHA domain-containing protein [Myxococcota bacterium]